MLQALLSPDPSLHWYCPDGPNSGALPPHVFSCNTAIIQATTLSEYCHAVAHLAVTYYAFSKVALAVRA